MGYFNNQVYWVGQDGNAYLRSGDTVSNKGTYLGGSANGFDSKGFSAEASRIADPNPPAKSSGGNSGGSNNYGSGGGGGVTYAASSAPAAPAKPAYDQNVVNQLDQSASIINSSIGRLGTQLGIADKNINNQYGNQNNELNTSKTNNQKSYNTSTTQNSQSYRGNKNVIADQASQGLRGLQRLLGAYGAGGSSDARYVAPEAVANKASQQRAGAGETFSQNQQGLDTNWNNFLGQFGNEKKKLTDWRTQQLDQAKQKSLTTKQDLLSKLADIKGQRAATIGGSYSGGAQSYLDKARGLSGQIDNLGRINPTYNGKTPTYTPHALSSYVAGNAANAQLGQPQNASQSLNNPYLALLLGQNRKDKQLLG